MTRKDYEMIAEVLADVKRETDGLHQGKPEDALALVAVYIADGLAQDNPRFDRRRFMAACGFPA